jgi:hypothetical protein
MNLDRAPLTNATLADALAIVSHAPELDPPLYICHRELCASAVQTFILDSLGTTSDPNTFWTREQGGVYDYTSGKLILRRRGIITGPDILASEHSSLVLRPPPDMEAGYDLRGDMRSPEYTHIRIGFPGREGYLHARAVWIDDGKWEDTAELATCTCDLCMSWRSDHAHRILTMV